MGVSSPVDERSAKDKALQFNFSCASKLSASQPVIGSGVGALGSAIEERSSRDRQLAGQFGCSSRENYQALIEPRTAKDTYMLKIFGGGCQEGYEGPARLNYNPYNSSSNVVYVPLR